VSNYPDWTLAIKKAMGDLGRKSGLKVSASGYPFADQGEFLYDMVWYELDEAGFVISQPMVMECEWKICPTTVVDDDFQKLVQARADVRVWVSTSANASDIRLHIENCEKQIRLFKSSEVGDQFVLLYFEWDTKSYLLKTIRATH
jgi:hypothetical protein